MNFRKLYFLFEVSFSEMMDDKDFDVIKHSRKFFFLQCVDKKVDISGHKKKKLNESIWFVCTQSTLCQWMFVWVRPSCMMRWHSGGKLSHALPIWEWSLQSVFVSWLLGGHPRFIHYLKSCSNSVWDVKHDSAFLYLRGSGSGSWQRFI